MKMFYFRGTNSDPFHQRTHLVDVWPLRGQGPGKQLVAEDTGVEHAVPGTGGVAVAVLVRVLLQNSPLLPLAFLARSAAHHGCGEGKQFLFYLF